MDSARISCRQPEYLCKPTSDRKLFFLGEIERTVFPHSCVNSASMGQNQACRPMPHTTSLRERKQQIKSSYDAGDFVRCASLCRPMLSRPPRPIDTGIALCYGKCLLQIDRRCDEALPFLRRAARQCPRDPEPVWADAQTFLAVALASSGMFEEAAAVLRAFAGTRLRSPASVGALQAHACLAVTNDWRRGWSAHESRRVKPAIVLRGVDATPRWDGVSGDPTAVAVIDEQGLGDAVLMARWIPWLIATAGRTPRFYGRAALRRWMEAAGCEFVERSVNTNAIDSAADPVEIGESRVALTMSLPHLAQCATPADIPVPFAPSALLRARAQRVDGRRGDHNLRRVGVCWTSTAANLNKQLRFSAEQFAEIWSPLHGVEFVNLTHEARVGASAPFGIRRFADVYETGELLTTLDVVVTVDTLVAHLAGSLGIPAIVIAPTYYDWRYRWPGERGSPFYRSVSLFRQQYGDDVSVLSRVRAHLVDVLARDERVSAEDPPINNHQFGGSTEIPLSA
jgi:hypothetical protein